MGLALWLILASAPAGPDSVLVEAGFREFARHGVRIAVAATADARTRAEHVRARYERAVDIVRANLGLAPETGACVVACGTRRQFRKVVELLAGSAPPDYAEAVALPAMRTVVISPASDPLQDKALAHETAHLALHARFARIPRWIDEGLAQWAAGQVPADREVRNLRHWAFRNGVIPFASLADELPPEPDELLPQPASASAAAAARTANFVIGERMFPLLLVSPAKPVLLRVATGVAPSSVVMGVVPIPSVAVSYTHLTLPPTYSV